MRDVESIKSDLHWYHARLHDSQESAMIVRYEERIRALNMELTLAEQLARTKVMG